MSAGRQWATGALATQREVVIDGPTYSFVGASTITRAATLYASNPTAGTFATITSHTAAWFEAATAITNNLQDVLRLSHVSSGATAANFALGILSELEESTGGTLVNASRIFTTWTVAASATATSNVVVQTRNNGAALATAATFDISVSSFTGGVQSGSTAGSAGFRVGSGNLSTWSQISAAVIGFRINAATINTTVFDYSTTNSINQPSWTFRPCAKVAQTGEAIAFDWDAATPAVTFVAGAIGGVPIRTHLFSAPTYAGTAGGTTLASVILAQYNTPAATGANMTFTQLIVQQVGSSATVGPSAATTTYQPIYVPAHTVTYTNTTASTAACSIAGVRIEQITLAQNTGAGTLTDTNAASLYIANAPVAAASAAFTNTYAVFVDAGLSRFDGNGTHVFELPADATGNVTVATGRVPINVTGVGTKYLRYFDD
jgi:hypothetical protein